MNVAGLRGLSGIIAVAFAIGQVSPARANELGAEDRAAVVELFGEGVRLAKLGQCDVSPVGDVDTCKQAHDIFARIYKLDAGALGALRNLAWIEEVMGLSASAAAHYRDLIRKAPEDPNPSHRTWGDWASGQLAKLQGSIPRLTVAPVAAPADLTILLDDVPLAASSWGVPIEVDPGARTIKADATGFHSFESRVEARVGESRTIVVALTQTVEANTARTAPAIESGEETSIKPATIARLPEAQVPATASRSILPWALIGTGGLTLGVGMGFGIAAISEHGKACPGDGRTCSAPEYNNGLALADTSTALVAAGGALAAVGIVWRLVSGHPANTNARWVRPVLVGSGIGIQGVFQ